MGPEASPRSWTLLGLTLAFLDLGLAYLLLCASALWFVWSKLLSLVGLWLPCPCRGVLGFVDGRLCLHKLLVDIPLKNILAVHVLVRGCAPFSSICYEEQGGGFNLKADKSSVASSGTSSPLVSRSLQERVAGDIKGKRVVSQKQQRNARRRRKIALGSGKCPSSIRNLGSSSVTERSSVYGDNEGMRSEIGESLTPLASMEGEFQVKGYEKVHFAADLADKSWQCLDLSESFDVGESAYLESSCAENFVQETVETVETIIDEANKMSMLEKSLEEVKAAYNAISLELEQERAAAATAAEEAMAMISRLQNEKASIAMEVRQKQRMVDEKLAYDEEEMNILKEILVRREMENFVLENEVEAFKQMMSSDENNSEDGPQIEDIPLLAPQVENCGMENEKAFVGSDNSTRQRLKQQVLQNENLKSDIPTSFENFETNGEMHKCLSCEREVSRKYGLDCDDDVPQVVYDVHVVNDKIEQPLKTTDRPSPVRDISSAVELINQRNSFDINDDIEAPGSVRGAGRTLSNGSSERLRLDSEMEWLRDILRKVQEEKEKLRHSTDNWDKRRIELKLLEDIRDQLKEIQTMGRPVRHT